MLVCRFFSVLADRIPRVSDDRAGPTAVIVVWWEKLIVFSWKLTRILHPQNKKYVCVVTIAEYIYIYILWQYYLLWSIKKFNSFSYHFDYLYETCICRMIFVKKNFTHSIPYFLIIVIFSTPSLIRYNYYINSTNNAKSDTYMIKYLIE